MHQYLMALLTIDVSNCETQETADSVCSCSNLAGLALVLVLPNLGLGKMQEQDCKTLLLT